MQESQVTKQIQKFKSQNLHHFVSNMKDGSSGLYYFLMGLYYEDGFGFQSDRNIALSYYKKGAELFDAMCLERLSYLADDHEIAEFSRACSCSWEFKKFSEAGLQKSLLPIKEKADYFIRKFGKYLESNIMSELTWVEPLLGFLIKPNAESYNEALTAFDCTIKNKISDKAGAITLLNIFLLHLSDREGIKDNKIQSIKRIIESSSQYLGDLCSIILEEAQILGIMKSHSPSLQRLSKIYLEIGFSVRYYSKNTAENRKQMNESFFRLSEALFNNQEYIEDEVIRVYIIRFYSDCYEKGIGVDVDFSNALKLQESEFHIPSKKDETVFSYYYFQIANLSRKKDPLRGESVDLNAQKSYDLTLSREKKNRASENGVSVLIFYRLGRIQEKFFLNYKDAQNYYEKAGKINLLVLNKARTFQYEVIRDKCTRKLISIKHKISQKMEIENMIGSIESNLVSSNNKLLNFSYEQINHHHVLCRGRNCVISCISVNNESFIGKTAAYINNDQVREILEVLNMFTSKGCSFTNHIVGFCVIKEPFKLASVMIVERPRLKTLSELVSENFFQNDSQRKLDFAINLANIINDISTICSYAIYVLEPSNILVENKKIISAADIKLNIPVIGKILISDRRNKNGHSLPLGYSAPELLKPDFAGSLKSDVWSLGMIFYSVFLGKLIDIPSIEELKLYSQTEVWNPFERKDSDDQIFKNIFKLIRRMVCLESNDRINITEVIKFLENIRNGLI